MADVPMPFDTKARRIEFFDRLDQLLNDYPELQTRMLRSYEEDPADEHWISQEENFDPQSPTLRTGLVLVIAHANMQMWEDVTFLEPPNQSRFLTAGLLTNALEAS